MRYLFLSLLVACGVEARTTSFNAPMSPVSKKAEHGTATIRFHHPDGVLALRGSAPLSWDSSTEVNGNAFSIELDDVLEFKPMHDAQWARGSNYRVRPGETVDIYPHFLADNGRVTLLFDGFYSQVMENTRPVWAYLPPSYDENSTASYPVVYMHDGQNVFDPSLAFGGNEWQADETVDRGVNEGWLREVIVIGVANTVDRMTEYTPDHDAGKYIQFITDELMPEVEKVLRVRTGPKNTAVVGSSLGGLVSSHAGILRPDVFGLIGAVSPTTGWADGWIIDAVKNSSVEPLRVWVDAGSVKDGAEGAAQLAQSYRDVGFVDEATLHFEVQEGASHNEVYWAQRLPGLLRFLFSE